MHAFFERLLEPLAARDVVQPPAGVASFYGHFLKPIRGLLVLTLAVAGLASLAELALFAFLGAIVDWMDATGREDFLAAPGWDLAAMALVAVVVRPALVLASRGLINLTLVPALTNEIRWQNYRWVLRQSLSFFQNDFAGRIAQRVMQTGPAIRESLVSLITGVWYILVYGTGAVLLLAHADVWLALPLLIWFAGYLVLLRIFVP
ncbi:MAG TPA: multidrug ABC transporter ATP-binding protein, partial [Arenibaculum sp.]|nr:multidrug ABC transporter ATP-binding protein [Arenibaculum sp.]